jgi:hypothetical protein
LEPAKSREEGEIEPGICPIDYDELKLTLETKFDVEVVLGTHSY